MSLGVPVAKDIAMPANPTRMSAPAKMDARASARRRAPAGFGLFHFTAQNQAGADVPDADQRRQGEQQRRQDRDADALRGGEEIPMRGGLQLEIAREKRGEGALHHEPECHAEQAARPGRARWSGASRSASRGWSARRCIS